jgi:hypothetical protein
MKVEVHFGGRRQQEEGEYDGGGYDQSAQYARMKMS